MGTTITNAEPAGPGYGGPEGDDAADVHAVKNLLSRESEHPSDGRPRTETNRTPWKRRGCIKEGNH